MMIFIRNLYTGLQVSIKQSVSFSLLAIYSAFVIFSGGCSGPQEADRYAGGGSSEKLFIAFSFEKNNNSGLETDTSGVIDNSVNTVLVYVPFLTDIRILKASFSFRGFSVTVNGVIQETGATVNDFSAPVTYVITAENGTEVDYTITVEREALTPSAPSASAVFIDGMPMTGALLTGSYSYTDPNLDEESGSERNWYRCAMAGLTDMTDCELISSDTGTASVPAEYSVSSADEGAYIYFEVIPGTTVEPIEGYAVLSSSTNRISNVNFSFEMTDADDVPPGWSADASILKSNSEGGATDGDRSAWLETLTDSYVNITSEKYYINHNDSVSISVDYKTDIEDQCRTIIQYRVYDAADNLIANKEQTSQLIDSTYLGWKTKSYSPTDKFYNASYIIITVRVKHDAADNEAKLWIDNVRVSLTADLPAAPVVSAPTITGTILPGQYLSGSYTFSDSNNDPESSSIRTWYRCPESGLTLQHVTGGECVVLSSDTGTAAVPSSYRLVSEDTGFYIYFTVVPKTAVEPMEGAAVATSGAGPVGEAAAASSPVASNTLITGVLSAGETLTGSYTYYDMNGDPESGSVRVWYRCAASGLTDMSGCVEITAAADTGTSSEPASYSLTTEDENKYIYFQVVPKTTVEPQTGDAVLSPAAGPVNNMNYSFEVVDAEDIPVNWSCADFTLYSTSDGGASHGTRSVWSAGLSTTYTDIVSTYRYPLTHNDKVSMSVDYKTDIAAQIRTQIRIQVYDLSDSLIATKDQTSMVLDSTYLEWKTKSYAPTDKYYNASYMIVTIRVRQEAVDNTAKFWLDNVRVTVTADTPAAPSVSALLITGEAVEGALLTGTYSYSDPNNDPESGSVRTWYSCGSPGLTVNDMTGASCIEGASDTGTAALPPQYTVIADDVDRYIYFTVRPAAAVSPAEGSIALSPASSRIQTPPDPAVPTAENLLITGIASTGEPLTGTYTYHDINGDPESESTRKWYRCGSSGLTSMSSGCIEVYSDTGTASEPSVYYTDTDDLYSYIYFEVTPTAGVDPAAGIPALSVATAQIIDSNYSFELVDEGDSPLLWSSNGAALYSTDEGGASDGTRSAWLSEMSTTAYTDIVSTHRFPLEDDDKVTVAADYKTDIAGQCRTIINIQIFDSSDTRIANLSQGSLVLGSDYLDWKTKSYAPTTRYAGAAYMIVTIRVKHEAADNTAGFWLDNVVLTRHPGTPAAPPIASDLQVTGETIQGKTLTGTYTYSDVNGDAEASSSRVWYRCASPGLSLEDISGCEQTGTDTGSAATPPQYTLTVSDVGSFIYFSVTPVTAVTPFEGTTVLSAASTIIEEPPAAVPPVASSPVLTGSAVVGETLTGSYSYYDINGDPESDSERRWYRCGSPDLTDMSGCVDITAAADTGTSSEPAYYTLAAEDDTKYIYFQVVPKTTVEPQTGEPVLSPAVGPVNNMNYSFEVVDAEDKPYSWTSSASILYSTDEGGAAHGTRSAWLASLTTTYTDIVSTYKYPIEHNDKVSLSVDYKTDIESQIRTQIKIQVYNSADDLIATKEQTALLLDSTYTGAWKTKSYAPTDKYYNASYMIITVRVKHEAAENTAKFYLDNVLVTTTADVPAAPTASAISITGNTFPGQVLTGSYTFSDSNNDPESDSIRTWYRCDSPGLTVSQMSGSECVFISSSTGTVSTQPVHTIVNDDIGKYIYLTVLPKTAVEPMEGNEVVSGATDLIEALPDPAPPVAADVTISGIAVVDGTLTGFYTYSDVNFDVESGSDRVWYSCTESGLTDMSGCTAVASDTGTASTPPVYSPVAADEGNYIYLEVTPNNAETPTTGDPVLSSATDVVGPSPYIYKTGLEIDEPNFELLSTGTFSNEPPSGTSARGGSKVFSVDSVSTAYTGRIIQTIDCTALKNDTDNVITSIWGTASTLNGGNVIKGRNVILWFNDSACTVANTTPSSTGTGTTLPEGLYTEVTLNSFPPTGATHIKLKFEVNDNNGGSNSGDDWAADDVSIRQ